MCSQARCLCRRDAAAGKKELEKYLFWFSGEIPRPESSTPNFRKFAIAPEANP